MFVTEHLKYYYPSQESCADKNCQDGELRGSLQDHPSADARVGDENGTHPGKGLFTELSAVHKVQNVVIEKEPRRDSNNGR